MRKLTTLLGLLALVYFGASCSDSPINEFDNTSNLPPLSAANTRMFGQMQRQCATMDVLNAQLQEDPAMRSRMDDIEKTTQKVLANSSINSIGIAPVINIPVVVNVLYRTSQENISLAQIQSQIDVLNEDFGGTNTDLKKTPKPFKPLIGNMKIRFTLVAINRKITDKTEWGYYDAIKKPNKGGIAATDPSRNLNIWVGNIGGGILGYAQFPGGKLATDGIVVGPNFFGRVGYLSSPFDQGRTATHEVGHWLNLYHIWGDDGNACWGSDLVADTPNAASENYGCPSFPSISCSNGPNGDLWMNFMDYTDDACMFMFSAGQTERARAVFAYGGPRYTFIR